MGLAAALPALRGPGMRLGLGLLAGLAQSVSMATPWDGQPLWWLQVAALLTLVALLDRSASVRQAALLGEVFGLAWLGGTFSWLYISMHTYGGLAAPLAVLAVLALAAFLSGYYAAACALYRWAAEASRSWRALLFAALWLGAELARNSWFTGFPWGATGYAHVDSPLAVFASWVGVHGLAFLAALLAATLACLPRLRWPVGRTMIAWGFVLGLLVPLLLASALTSEASVRTGRLQVTLLQGNIPQDEKFQPGTGVPDALRWYGEQLRQAATPLVVAPETALPLLPKDLPDGYWASLVRRYTLGEQAALIGMPMGSYDGGYTNSVIGLAPGNPGSAPYQYDKHHLVPFGEFTPPLFRWFTRLMDIPLGDFNRGGVGQNSMAWRGQRLAPNICYEDLFGEELALRFVRPAVAPTILVNVGNIGWFGDSLAIDQHLHISRMRALEFERPMLRATNTGPTVIIDYRGRVTDALERRTRGVLVGEVEGRKGVTPYARWVSRLGLWPLWGLSLLALLAGAWRTLALRATRKALGPQECHP